MGCDINLHKIFRKDFSVVLNNYSRHNAATGSFDRLHLQFLMNCIDAQWHNEASFEVCARFVVSQRVFCKSMVSFNRLLRDCKSLQPILSTVTWIHVDREWQSSTVGSIGWFFMFYYYFIILYNNTACYSYVQRRLDRCTLVHCRYRRSVVCPVPDACYFYTTWQYAQRQFDCLHRTKNFSCLTLQNSSIHRCALGSNSSKMKLRWGYTASSDA